jgi:uncharacterized protein (DUF433 family)
MAALATGIVSNSDIMDGEPVIEDTRVRVMTLYRASEENNLDPATVAEKYEVSIADVHRAIAYYYDNLEQMADQERRRQELREQALDSRATTLGDLRREHDQSQHAADGS